MGLFGVSKKALRKYPHLSPQDAELCWKLFRCEAHKESDYLNTAVKGQRYDALAEMCKLDLGSYGMSQAFATAYRAHDLRALELLAASNSLFSMDSTRQEMLFENVTEYSDPWCEGLAHCLPKVKKLSLDKQIDAIFDLYTSRDDQALLLKKLYSVHPAKGAEIAIACIGWDAFDLALDTMPIDTQTPVVLARACCALISNMGVADKPAKLDRMIKMGMNVNYDKGVVLSTALHTRNFDLAQKIVDAGFNRILLGESVLEGIYSSSGHPEAIAFMENLLGRGQRLPSACGVTQTLEHDGFALMAPDTVARRIALPDGGHLSVIFNFTLRQQIVVAHQASVAPSAPTIVPFHMLSDVDVLFKAADAFKALGGNSEIAERASLALRPLIAHKPEAKS